MASPIALTRPVRPDPAYVAESPASMLGKVAQRQRLKSPMAPDHDPGPEVDDARFVDSGLVTINNFLDHLLYTFLVTASASSLRAIRPAVEQVLKGKLARESVLSAEEELEGLLGEGGEDEEELVRYQDNQAEALPWDLDTAFRRTRVAHHGLHAARRVRGSR